MPDRSSLRAAFLAAAIATLVSFASAPPAWSYTVYLKDGSRLVTTEKYKVKGDKAFMRLESGTETVLPLAEIDVERTEKTNQNNIGTAVIIEGGQIKDLDRNTTPPPKRATLQDLIQSRGEAPAPEAVPSRRAPRPGAAGSEAARRGEAGARTPLRNTDVAESIRRFLFGRGVTSVEVLQGASSTRPQLVFSTANEGQVFKALTASATALLHVRDRHPGDVEAFDVVCSAPTGGSAGRFLITPPQAQELVAGRIDLPAFYVRYVIF